MTSPYATLLKGESPLSGSGPSLMPFLEGKRCTWPSDIEQLGGVQWKFR